MEISPHFQELKGDISLWDLHLPCSEESHQLRLELDQEIHQLYGCHEEVYGEDRIDHHTS